MDVVMFRVDEQCSHSKLQRIHDERSKIRHNHGILSILRSRRHTNNDNTDMVRILFVFISGKR